MGEVSNECYALYNDAVNSTLDQYQIDWWPTPAMLEPRVHAASVQILEAGLTSQYNWWVSGGQDKNLDVLKSTEIRWSNGTWAEGPLLPSEVYGHCVVQIQRQKSLLLGGHPFIGNYIYDWVSRVSYHDLFDYKLISILMTGKSGYVSGVVAWALDILIGQLAATGPIKMSNNHAKTLVS